MTCAPGSQAPGSHSMTCDTRGAGLFQGAVPGGTDAALQPCSEQVNGGGTRRSWRVKEGMCGREGQHNQGLYSGDSEQRVHTCAAALPWLCLATLGHARAVCWGLSPCTPVYVLLAGWGMLLTLQASRFSRGTHAAGACMNGTTAAVPGGNGRPRC